MVAVNIQKTGWLGGIAHTNKPDHMPDIALRHPSRCSTCWSVYRWAQGVMDGGSLEVWAGSSCTGTYMQCACGAGGRGPSPLTCLALSHSKTAKFGGCSLPNPSKPPFR